MQEFETEQLKIREEFQNEFFFIVSSTCNHHTVPSEFPNYTLRTSAVVPIQDTIVSLMCMCVITSFDVLIIDVPVR